MISFGHELNGWRTRSGISRRELAKLVGVSATHIGNLERDLSPSSTTSSAPLVSREMCDQLSRVLQVPRHLVYLAAYVPELDEYDMRTKRLVAIFEELPPNRQDEVLAYLELIWKLVVAQPPVEPKEHPDTAGLKRIVEGRK